MLECELILSPSEDCREVLIRRMALKEPLPPGAAEWGGVLLVQGRVAQLMAAVDIATKAAMVCAREVWGNCPQHITTIAFIGDAAEVRQAMNALRDRGMIA